MSSADQDIQAAPATAGVRVVEAFERLGVEVVFGLPGVHNLAIWKALSESAIRLIGVRHGQAAVCAADGYARAAADDLAPLVPPSPLISGGVLSGASAARRSAR